MSKGWMVLMKTERRKNKGFTIVELIAAIAILGVLSVTVSYMMNTSAKTYKRLSVESQLQSEAQLVANAITELAIDSYTAVDELPEDFAGEGGNFKGGSLLLETQVDGLKQNQYLIVPDEEQKALFLVKRTYNSSNDTWTYSEDTDREILASYVSGFSVDTSRVEKENMIEFTLVYEKNGRSYQGNYQVLMRNRAYADKEKENEEDEPTDKVVISIDPQIVYVDVIGDTVPSYYVSSVSEANKRTLTGAGVPFSAKVVTNNKNANKNVKWDLKNEDDSIFSMSEEEAEKSNLEWDMSNDKIKKSAIDMFTLVITKTIESSNGVKIEASPKTAQILLRRIKSLDLYALSGTTPWSDRFADVFGGTKDPDASGYAYKNASGQYLPINLNVSISASNVAYGGGLTWKLYRKSDSGAWTECNDSAFASLYTNLTETSTSNVVTLGPAAENGQVYKVVATSVFDSSYSDEYVFGIAPSGPMNDDGFYSRGYYTDMGALLKGFQSQGDAPAVNKLVYLAVTSVTSVENAGTSLDKIKVIKDAAGNWRLYIDFDAFSYSGAQKESFYRGVAEIHLVIGYYDSTGRLCVAGDTRTSAHEAAIKAQEGRDIDVYANGRVVYSPKPVTVTKVNPEKPIIVVEKGKSKGVTVKTAYYNILSPRKGTYYFGAYMDDMYNNLLESGKTSTHAYFDVEMASAYGDTNVYVDNALVQVTAKSDKTQKKYLIQPKKLRLTANDFYLIKVGSPDINSYTDYEVLIANVEGTSCYIPGPEAQIAEVNSEDIVWSDTEKTSIEAGTETEVTGLSSSGATVTAKIRKEGTKYYCEYNGDTYLYRPAYNCWK